MHYLSFIYFVTLPLHVSGMFIAHHQEVFTVCVQQLVRVMRLGWLAAGRVIKKNSKIHGQQNIKFACTLSMNLWPHSIVQTASSKLQFHRFVTIKNVSLEVIGKCNDVEQYYLRFAVSSLHTHTHTHTQTDITWYWRCMWYKASRSRVFGTGLFLKNSRFSMDLKVFMLRRNACC
jgi:hypothetical protein